MEVLLALIQAAELLTSRGVPFTCRAVRDANRHEANAAVITLLQGASRYAVHIKQYRFPT